MLRLTVVLLALANGAFFAWQAGWLPGLSAAAPKDAASDRLADQVHPERLLVITGQGLASAPGVLASSATNASTASTAPSTPAATASVAQSPVLAASGDANPAVATQCLEAGPFTAEENRQALSQVSKVLPKGSWSSQAVGVPGLWLVYMGPYADAEALQRKLVELRRLRNLSFEEVRSPSNLAMGVSLGRFADERAANAALETMRLRGVRTARVVNARPAMELMVLRVAQASTADQGKLGALPLPAGKGFIACAN